MNSREGKENGEDSKKSQVDLNQRVVYAVSSEESKMENDSAWVYGDKSERSDINS